MIPPRQSFPSCETESLHLSGAIQPHGVLLACDALLQVSHASANSAWLLRLTPEQLLGAPLPAPLQAFVAGLGTAQGSRLLSQVDYPQPGQPSLSLDVSATRGALGVVVLELTPSQEADDPLVPVALQRRYRIADPAAVQSAREELVREVRSMTGAHRVLYYDFQDDGDGEVLAEDRDAQVYGSYLGLRFPASDIPQIARALYLRNPWRLIQDCEAEPVPLLGLEAKAAPPDLTYSDLRSVSPMHIAYLCNMHVRTSLSFPVVCGGVLEALITVHHGSPLALSRSRLEQISYQVRQYSVALALQQGRQRILLMDGLGRRMAPAVALLQRHGNVASAWPEWGPWLQELLESDGVELVSGGMHLRSGMATEPSAMQVIDDWFCQEVSEDVWMADHLIGQLEYYPLAHTAGVAALRIRGHDGSWFRLYATRREYLHEIHWGGRPDKPAEGFRGAINISPRQSFEKWVEKRIGYSRPWRRETRMRLIKLLQVLLSHKLL